MLVGAGFGPEQRALGQHRLQCLEQLGTCAAQVACRANAVDLTADVHVGKPFEPRPVAVFDTWAGHRHGQQRRVMEGGCLSHPGSDRGADDVVIAEHRDARNLVQVDAQWCAAHRALGVQ